MRPSRAAGRPACFILEALAALFGGMRGVGLLAVGAAGPTGLVPNVCTGTRERKGTGVICLTSEPTAGLGPAAAAGAPELGRRGEDVFDDDGVVEHPGEILAPVWVHEEELLHDVWA